MSRRLRRCSPSARTISDSTSECCVSANARDTGTRKLDKHFCFSGVCRRRRRCSVSKRNITGAGASKQFNDTFHSKLTKETGQKETPSTSSSAIPDCEAHPTATGNAHAADLRQQALRLLYRRRCSCHQPRTEKAQLHLKSLRVQVSPWHSAWQHWEAELLQQTRRLQ